MPVEGESLRKAVQKSMNVRHFDCMGKLVGRETQTKAVITHLTGALDPKTKVWDDAKEKTCSLAIAGGRGIGKTMFLRHLAGARDMTNGLIESSCVGGKAVTVSFSESPSAIRMCGQQGEDLFRSFGVQLLTSNKVPFEIAEKVASFDDAILLVREHLQLTATEPLTVLVDDMHMFGDDKVQAIVAFLKAHQDKTVKNGVPPVLFVFATLTALSVLKKSRDVDVVHLTCLSDDIGLSLLPDHIAALLRENDELYFLYRILQGHPRAIKDGLGSIKVEDLKAAADCPLRLLEVQQEITKKTFLLQE